MIDLKNVEESVKYFRKYDNMTYLLLPLVELAESFLAALKEMPKKRIKTSRSEWSDSTDLIYIQHEEKLIDTQNKIIDECTLVTTRLLAEKDELIERLERDIACLRSAWQDKREELERLKEENRVLKVRLSNFTDKENNV